MTNKKSTENDTETGRSAEEESNSESESIYVAPKDIETGPSAEEESKSNSESMDVAQKDTGRVVIHSELSRDQKRTLLLARLASFINGASYACHIALLPIQVTSLVDLDGE